MTLSEFILKYAGRKVDYDGYYGAQCVDLFRTYCEYVWGLPHMGSVEGAKDLWHRWERLPLEKAYLDRLQEPRQGDVVVWDESKTNPFGHVAIYVCDIDGQMLVFEQNGFKQDGAKLALRTRDNLLGFLRKKE